MLAFRLSNHLGRVALVRSSNNHFLELYETEERDVASRISVLNRLTIDLIKLKNTSVIKVGREYKLYLIPRNINKLIKKLILSLLKSKLKLKVELTL